MSVDVTSVGTDGLALMSLPSTDGGASAPLVSVGAPAKAFTDSWARIEPKDNSYRTPAGGTHCGNGWSPLPLGGGGGGAGEQTPVAVRRSVIMIRSPEQLTTR